MHAQTTKQTQSEQENEQTNKQRNKQTKETNNKPRGFIHRMQIWRTTRLAPGTSMKVRLVRPRCFVLTMLPLKNLASWTV